MGKNKRIEKIKDTVFKLSALLILLAAIVFEFNALVATVCMIVGVIGFAWPSFTTPYPGKSLRGKRLVSIRVFGVMSMAISAYLMFERMNEWVIFTLIGVLLTLYSAILIPREYAKEKNEDKGK